MILVYAEHTDGLFKKSSFEAVTLGRQLANELGTKCEALVIGNANDPGSLGIYGAEAVHEVKSDQLSVFDSKVYASIIAQAAEKLGANYVVLSHSSQGKALAGRLAVRMDAGVVSGINSFTSDSGKITWSKGVYSGKASAQISISTDKAVVTVMGNAISPQKNGSEVSTSEMQVDIPASNIKLVSKDIVSGEVPLTEAELVVSAGRGMKGPDNWGIIEELAKELGAATACSRPVSDADWRPHHEHVGQTGIAIRPNLYIAVGISGAIQHLAGVNNSKVIVVINKDPEAPFFKAADYGVVGDLFDVVPKLTEAVKAFKNS